MPREFTRNDRVSDALQRELAELIRDEVRDPRLKMVNITGVEVNRDLANAKVFVTFVGSDSEDESMQAAKILNGASGFLRSLLAKRMQMRTTPRLHFIYDPSSKRGQDLSALIDTVVKTDNARRLDSDASSSDSSSDTSEDN
ncbi:MAG: 30S ribosome-binding factor RbfA [Porticoccus sp.]|nr:30S ribosome-binding factor RbfA [Porticoccus sp.]MBQ0807809.1 30S ribosome-binding factor RbfA [Porticoccus sp.]